MWTLVPFLLAIIVAASAGSPVVKVLVWVAGFLVMSFCHLKFVSLVKR